MFSFDFLAVCYGHFRQWCVLLPVSLYVKVFQCMLILSFLAICCSISSDSPRKRKGCSRVIKCRKLVTVSFYFCTILSSPSIVILIFFNPTKIIQNKSMYHNISNIYVSSFKSVLGERFSLKERERSLKFAYLVAYATHQFCFFGKLHRSDRDITLTFGGLMWRQCYFTNFRACAALALAFYVIPHSSAVFA